MSDKQPERATDNGALSLALKAKTPEFFGCFLLTAGEPSALRRLRKEQEEPQCKI